MNRGEEPSDPHRDEPLTISIVTPSFNQGEFLDETIRSVLLQRGDFLIDYIVMDGGSTDGSVAIIEKYESLVRGHGRLRRIGDLDFHCSDDPEFPWNRCRGISYRWQSGPDGGQIQALRSAFPRCVGAIVAWINSDDYFLGEDAFARVLERHRAEPQAMLLTGDCSVVDRQGRELWKWAMGRIHLQECIYLDYHIAQSSTFVRRDVLARYDLDPTKVCTFDTDLFISVLDDGNQLAKIDVELSAFRMYGDNLTADPAHKAKAFREKMSILLKHGDRPWHTALSVLYQFLTYLVEPRADPKGRLGRLVRRAIDRFREFCYRTVIGETYAQRFVR